MKFWVWYLTLVITIFLFMSIGILVPKIIYNLVTYSAIFYSTPSGLPQGFIDLQMGVAMSFTVAGFFFAHLWKPKDTKGNKKLDKDND